MILKIVKGPINSRRLGRSLGVNLLPYKTCTMDCVYCECNATTNLTLERAEFFPLQDVLKELDYVLSSKPQLDSITFSGAGEPTLYSRLGEVISYLKQNYPQYKITLLTNAHLLNQKSLVEEIKEIDLLIPSIDGVSTDVIAKINKPLTYDLEEIVKGLLHFKKISKAKIWIEYFVIEHVNDTENELAQLKNLFQRISPDLIHLNSLDRNGTEDWVKKAAPSRLEEIQKKLSPLKSLII